MAANMIQTGIIADIFSKDEYFDGARRLVLQVQNAKAITSEGKRARVVFTDGKFSTHAMIGPDSITKSDILKNDIIAITKYELEILGANNKHVILVDEFEVLERNAERVGSDKPELLDLYMERNPHLDKLADAVRSREMENNSAAATAAPQLLQPQPPTAARSNTKKPNNLCLIEHLSPYQNVWTLKARVSYKGDLRTWTNARGTGKLFNVNFLDESGEIRGTAFNENAENFHQLLQENKVYYISKARIQAANKKFSSLDNAYELTLDKDTVFEEVQDAGSVPTLKYDFVKLNKIQDVAADSIVDIVGVIKEVNQPFQITSRAGKAYDRRDVLIVDDSQFAVSVGLWNRTALNFDIPEGSVVAIKGCKVSDFGGKTLSLTPSSVITQNPEVNEAYTIKGWYDAQGRREQFQTMNAEPGAARKTSPADRKNIEEVIALETEITDAPVYHNVKATVGFIRSENFAYPACSSEKCAKKVVEQGDGTWRCEKCDINHAQPRYRYMLTMSIMDSTGNLWVTLFDDHSEALLGISANELMALKEEGDSNKSAQFFDNVQNNEYDFRIRGRMDSYNGTERVRYNAYGATKIDLNAECNYLIEKFQGL